MIKIGRHDQIPRYNRLCSTSGSNQIEDEIHFLFDFPKYSILEQGLYRKTEYNLLNIKLLFPIEASKKINDFS